MTNFTITIGGTSVELPADPSEFIDDIPSDSITAPKTANLPMLIGKGKKLRKLTVSGRMYDPAKTKAQLYTTICNVLQGFAGKQVALSNTGLFDGDWYLDDAKFTGEPGYTRSVKFTMVFYQASSYIVVM